jgi:hypothetical protein
VLRRLLFAVLVCLSMWTLADAMGELSGGDNGGRTAIVAVSPSDLPDDADGPSSRWDAPPSLSIAATGLTAYFHVDVPYIEPPGVAARQPSRLSHRSDAATPTRSRPPHLHDIPLLI